MTREHVLQLIEDTRIIAILRGALGGRELEIVSALERAGIAAVELSIVSPDFDAVLSNIASAYSSRLAIGAGTVLSSADLGRAIAAGASFIVSPDSNPAVIEATLRADLVSLPGALTPTEVVQAARWGADAVKLFPAGMLGAQYLRAIRAPLPDIHLVPTGGISLANLPEYWQAGAWAAGIGSELVNPSRIAGTELIELELVARSFAQAALRR